MHEIAYRDYHEDGKTVNTIPGARVAAPDKHVHVHVYVVQLTACWTHDTHVHTGQYTMC